MEHALLVMQWRNDPTTLSMFFHSDPKTMPDFFHEFVETYFMTTRCQPVFAVLGDERVAFLKFDHYKEYGDPQEYIVDVSINVKPDCRGKGIGTKVLQNALVYLRDSGVDGVVAEIKKENTASIKSFTKAGFAFLDEQQKILPSLPQRFHIVRLYKKL